MRFFTYDWWQGCQGPGITTDPIKEYRKHLESIRDTLTRDILRLEDEVSLHDGELVELIVSLVDRLVTLRINGYDGRGSLRKFTLVYSGVSAFRSQTNGREGLGGPAGYGHLRYWEVDVVHGGFEHSILFSTGIELEIAFESLDLRFVDE